MKKLLLLIAASFVVFATAQCGSDGNNHGLQKPDQERVYWSVGTWSDAVTAESWTEGEVTSDAYVEIQRDFGIYYGWIKFEFQENRRTPPQIVKLRNEAYSGIIFYEDYDPRKVLEDLWTQGLVEYAVIYHPGDTYFVDPLYEDYEFEIYWSQDPLNIWTYEDEEPGNVALYDLDVTAWFIHHDI